MKMKKMLAFTMMELMIALAIVGILAAVAIPSYRNYTLKSNRTDGLQTALSIQLAEERYRMKNTTYGTIAQVWNNVTTSTGGFYTIAISNVTATSYTITLTATGNQAADTEDGTSCSPLVLTYSNNSVTKTPTNCWTN